ncbi:MAG: HEAT repeat domain-containing protein, partial [Phycisphaeraceae bacterium]
MNAQPIDTRIDRDPAVEDYDFAWVYWFETHGQTYLREAVKSGVGDRALPWDTPASRRWRGQVIDALVPMLEDEDDRVRAASVLALARIGHEPLLDRVLPGNGDEVSLLLDVSGEVRLSAWVSLGLLQTATSRAALGVEPLDGAEEIDRVGQAVAIGLMTKLDRVHAAWLLARLDDPNESIEAKRWCIWAMTRHDDASVDVAFDAVLTKLPGTFLISEVLGNSAYAQRSGGANWLVDVLRYHP